MSRAFAPGESEDDEERIFVKRSVLPPGTPNFITPAGLKKLESERERLTVEKDALADTVEAKQRKKTIALELDLLLDRLSQVTIVHPETQPKDRVLFGATVTVKDGQGKAQNWRIVGVDEVDLDQGWISWISPLARGLLEKKIGETVVVGNQTLTISAIR